MPLRSPRFASNARLQAASENNPPIRLFERGEAVGILQKAFVDLGFSMPRSMRSGRPDGVFGQETLNTVRAFQQSHHLSTDGGVGRQTLATLDGLFLGGGPIPGPATIYVVPGLKTVIRQPSPMSCWATVYCMMRSWKDQRSWDLRGAVAAVGPKWAAYYDASYPPTSQGLPSNEFGPFLTAARMQHDPMWNLPLEQWVRLLRTHGLLWIGASVTVNPNTGLHSRILEGVLGSGQPNSTLMKIIDPATGTQYAEPYMTFQAKYEAGFRSISGDYFQIRYF